MSDDCIVKWWNQVVVSNLKYTAKSKWEEVKREKAIFVLTILIFAMLLFCIYTTKTFRQNPAITEQYSNLIYSFLVLSILFDLSGFLCSPRLRPWLSCVCYLISIWFLVGSFLALYDYGGGVNWVSDWINAAVALGTIGAVATSLYLANRKPSFSIYGTILPDCEDYLQQVVFKVINDSNLQISLYDITIPSSMGHGIYSVGYVNQLLSPYEVKTISADHSDVIREALIKEAHKKEYLITTVHTSVGRVAKNVKIIDFKSFYML